MSRVSPPLIRSNDEGHAVSEAHLPRARRPPIANAARISMPNRCGGLGGVPGRHGYVLAADLEQIANMTRVPSEFRTTMAHEIELTVMGFTRHRESDYYSKETRACLRRVARIAQQLGAALDRLEGAPSHIFEYLIEELVCQVRNNMVADGQSPVSRFRFPERLGVRECGKAICEFAEHARSMARPKRREFSHRPPGSVKNPTFHELVRILYLTIVRHSHGELTVRKTSRGELAGTLPV